MNWFTTPIHKILKTFVKSIDSSSTYSNMRLNVTMSVIVSNICILGISVALVRGYWVEYTNGDTLLGWGVILTGIITSVLVLKNKSKKNERDIDSNQPPFKNDTK